MQSRYTKEQRYEIGRKIYNGELTVAEAARIYEINYYTARDYHRKFKESLSAPNLKNSKTIYQMSREELMEEIIRLRQENLRLEKECLKMAEANV